MRRKFYLLDLKKPGDFFLSYLCVFPLVISVFVFGINVLNCETIQNIYLFDGVDS